MSVMSVPLHVCPFTNMRCITDIFFYRLVSHRETCLITTAEVNELPFVCLKHNR